MAGEAGEGPGEQREGPGEQGVGPGVQGSRGRSQGEGPGEQGERPREQGEGLGEQGEWLGEQGERPGVQGEGPGEQGVGPGGQGSRGRSQGEGAGRAGKQPGGTGERLCKDLCTCVLNAMRCLCFVCVCVCVLVCVPVPVRVCLTCSSCVCESCTIPLDVPFFHGSVVRHDRNTKKNVARHSAITERQNSIDLSSPWRKAAAGRAPRRLNQRAAGDFPPPDAALPDVSSGSISRRLHVHMPAPECAPGWSRSDSMVDRLPV